jgi:predicted dehydrogenase
VTVGGGGPVRRRVAGGRAIFGKLRSEEGHPLNKQFHRRHFLHGAAGGLAASFALPTYVPASAIGRAGQAPPSQRVVLGSIGTGDLGRRHHLANRLLPNKRIEVAAVCDVDQSHREQAAQLCRERTQKEVAVYRDFRDLLDRKDIDAVLIATPDHWHALIAIYAMEAGKDVYCEKPLTLTIAESKAVAAAAKRYGTVFQTGSQQRSDRRFRQACELVRNGKIGKLTKVTTHIGGIDSGSWQSPETPPPELDWNFWLGPAPYADYSPNRCHYQFRWFLDYSGGKMTDWGAHHNDIAQWGIGADGSGPTRVEGTGKFHDNGPHDVPGSFEVTYTYGKHGDVQLVCHSEGENGVNFYGSNGHIFVSRGTIRASDPEILKIELGANDTRLEVSRDHHENWLDCIQSRKNPICHADVGHRSVTVCHLGNIAIRLGRPLSWDPDKEEFVDDPAANRLMNKPMRAPWHI